MAALGTMVLRVNVADGMLLPVNMTAPLVPAAVVVLEKVHLVIDIYGTGP